MAAPYDHRRDAAAVAHRHHLLDGSVLISGGIGNIERPVRDAEIFITPQ